MSPSPPAYSAMLSNDPLRWSPEPQSPGPAIIPTNSQQRSVDTSQQGDERGLPCQLCACLIPSTGIRQEQRAENLAFVCEKFFHEPCAKCLPLEPDLEPLCPFCSHLRLPHIFGCAANQLGHALFSRLGMAWYTIVWGESYEQLVGDQTCPLCALIGATLKNVTKRGQDHGDFTNGLVFVQFSARDSEGFLKGTAWVPEIWNLDISPVPDFGHREQYGATIKINMMKDDNGKATPLNPALGLGVNWDLVRGWIHDCQLNHKNQDILKDTMGEHFRLIDVEDACLIYRPTACSYAALSYVWGEFRAQELQTVLSNAARLEEKGSLLRHELPQCILDALTACKRLGIRFLWVDRLCIVQDDSQSKHSQISWMGEIYASAIVTIVAAAGKDARHGLVGVSKPRAMVQQKLVLQGVELTETINDFSGSVHQSVWRTRGWTFQEEMLSTALLLFSEHGVSFRCRHDPQLTKTEGLSHTYEKEEPDVYPYVVRRYCQRELGYESDILNAFSGYLGMMFGDQHHFGLPCADFNQALLWTPTNDAGYPRKSNNHEVFPSWSWASVVGPVDYTLWSCMYRARYEPVAVWAAVELRPGRAPQLVPLRVSPSRLDSSLAQLRKIWDDYFETESKSMWPRSDRVKPNRSKLYGLVESFTSLESAWWKSKFQLRSLSFILHGKLTRLWTTLPQRVKTYEKFWFRNQWLGMKHHLSPKLFRGSREAIQSSRLLVYTQSARVSVARGRSRGPDEFVLTNKIGKRMGFVHLDKPTIQRIDAHAQKGEIFTAECLALSLYMDDDGPFTAPLFLEEYSDFVRDLHRSTTDLDTREEKMKEKKHEFFQELGCLNNQCYAASEENCPPRLTVMMIERREGVARRAGVGIVYLKRWRESAPSLQTVVLE